ncbi:LytR/AlgR family response regulator transcription factor [Algoriphagus resistens]|uniref:LytR/AlgR family response regulator transcription factor n=1 Tax=Algoriphagus resistens TaxID=1750590 RepID=UPI00071682B9|nr:LytTR family DNA-binding domain-containing protein [Algoriphagus resistens]
MRNQITCIIIDDEPFAVQLLNSYAEKISFLEVIYAGKDVFQAMGILSTQKIDLIFLDIQMPELTGIEFMQTVKKDQNFIITSAYPQYALEAFNFNVIDFLLKPITFQRFYKSLEKYLQWKEQFSESTNSEDLFVRADRKVYRIPFDQIIYIEGLRDYIRIHTTEEKLMVYENMKDIYHKLPKGKFLRIHRSYIISIQHIRVLEGNFVELQDSTQLTIGETYRKEIGDFFKS